MISVAEILVEAIKYMINMVVINEWENKISINLRPPRTHYKLSYLHLRKTDLM